MEDQTYILNEILTILKEEQVEALFIAGDVYDRGVPSVEAVNALNDFLTSLAQSNIHVYMIAGNHDSPSRLAFGSRLLAQVNIHIVGSYEGALAHFIEEDSYGEIHIYGLPFVRPAYINRYIEKEEEKVTSYQEAIQKVITEANIDWSKRNLILAHQFVIGAHLDTEGSEEIMVGGVDQIDANLFQAFDYTALGHIHRPQKVKQDNIRYSGTPLAYSFAEKEQIKSIPIITIQEKGDMDIQYVELKPYRKMAHLETSFKELLEEKMRKQYEKDYLHITLTDAQEIEHAIVTLRNYYPYLLRLDYKQQSQTTSPLYNKEIHKSKLELFEDFFTMRNQKQMSMEQKAYVQNLMDTLEKEKNV